MFSNGKIINSSFNQVGGDGIDTSGSRVKIHNIYMKDIYDKSFSIGEKSKVDIKNSYITDVGVGIVSKDESKTISENNNIKNYKLAKYLAYNKKYYGGLTWLSLMSLTIRKIFFLKQVHLLYIMILL